MNVLKEKEMPEIICRSVFKNGKSTITKSEFTKKWTDIINKIEKEKVLE